MTSIPSFNAYIQDSIVNNWNSDALTDFKGATLQYNDVARKIEKLHILFEHCGIKPHDKIALCGRNSAHWAVAFMATLTYGAVAVPIQHEFKAEQIHNIVNHSDARLLFVGDVVAKTINADEMPNIEGIVYNPDYSLLFSRSETLNYAREHLNELFGKKFPKVFTADDISYYKDEAEMLAMINYTSGTTGFSKGVMIPYRALWGNLDYCMRVLGSKVPNGSNMLSILPMAHMYGMTVEFIFSFCHGCHIFFLTRLPSPAVIADAFAEIKPAIVITVPMVVEKIIRKRVFPKIQSKALHLLLNMPVVNKRIKQRVCGFVMQAFGGSMYEVVVGGAPLNQEIENFLHRIDFPVTVGYGTTECAPLITFSDYHDYKPGSCGLPVDHMEVKILSNRPSDIPGEIVARGTNVMLGYYKNDEATQEVVDSDGWYHTGDLGTMSADGHVYIKGRIKNMLLGSNGQNVYPEEIEDKLNSMAMVNESIIVQQGDKLVALVHPEFEEAYSMGLNDDDIANIMEQNRQQLNVQLASFCKISKIEIHKDEFEKTPKKSIKRYLYKREL